MKTSSQRKGNVDGDDVVYFHLVAAIEQVDVPSPEEEEDFRLHHYLRKIREKLGICFSMIWRLSKREEAKPCSRGQIGPHLTVRELGYVVDPLLCLPGPFAPSFR
jgi:hypothetical protein